MPNVNLQNAVIKSENGLIKGAITILKTEGIAQLMIKSWDLFQDTTKRFFREYLPLKYLYLFSHNGVIRKKIHGNTMILDLNDLGISRELAIYGVHENNSSNEVKRLVKPGMKILEVGANIGYYAILETKLAGPTGFLYALEPSSYNFKCLERNIKLNKIENCELLQKAAGPENGTAQFFIADRSNLSSFVERRDMDMYKDGRVERVEIIKLDNYLTDKTVDFIRMDVEGYEVEILKGLEETMRKKHPKHFFIEIHSTLLHKKNESSKQLVEYLKKFGYEVIKSFYRGGSITVTSTEALLNHPKLEEGYWETFFEYKEN